MVDIVPLAVGAADLVVGSDPVPGKDVSLALAAPLVRWSLRARDEAALAGVLGRPIPTRIGTSADGIARLGPDEWHALLPAGTPVPVANGATVSIVDVSSRSVGFTLSGSRAAAVLASGCPLDLERFSVGRATRTVFETVEIQIWRLAEDQWHVEVWRSFAPWLWNALSAAVAEQE